MKVSDEEREREEVDAVFVLSTSTADCLLLAVSFEGQARLTGDEGSCIPVSLEEDVPSGEETDDGDHEDGVEGSIVGEVGLVWQGTSIESLCLHSSSELDVGDGDSEPRHQSSDGGNVGLRRGEEVSG